MSSYYITKVAAKLGSDVARKLSNAEQSVEEGSLKYVCCEEELELGAPSDRKLKSSSESNIRSR